MRSLFLILISACAACAPDEHPVEISFAIQLNGEPISCSQANGDVRLTDLRFYVADVVVKDANAEWQPLTLVSDDIWQNGKVALIDLETGEGACLNGSTETNAVIRGTVSSQPEAGLAFSVGVPESLNHADPLSAQAPLGYTEMHWHWASGYKFMRAGVQTDNDGFFLHLGSNRCAGTIGDIKGCQGANRVAVLLTEFRAGQDTVMLDIGALFDGVDLHNGDTGECMSGPANIDCAAPFSALGLDFQTGESIMSAPVFSTGRP